MRNITNWWSENQNLTKEWSILNKKHFSEVTLGFNKKVYWTCQLNTSHTWEATIWSRVGCHSGCPYCSGRRITSENNLQKLNPDIVGEWSLKNDKSPSEVSSKSNINAWWKCSFGHEWQTRVYNRTKLGGTNCPYCSGKRPTEDNNLLNLYPHLCKQWSLKNNMSPEKFLSKSHKKVWWVCCRGHEYLSSIASRTSCQSGCPVCSWQTSKLEMRLYCELKTIFPTATWRDKSLGFEVDILLPIEKLAIEVDGWYWHRDKVDKDRLKNNKIIKHGFTPLRIRGNPLCKINDYDISFKKLQSENIIVPNVINKICNMTNINFNYVPWLNDLDFQKILSDRQLTHQLG